MTRNISIAFLCGLLALASTACSPPADTIIVATEVGSTMLVDGKTVGVGQVTVIWDVKADDTYSYGLWMLTLEDGHNRQDLLEYLSSPGWAADFPPAWTRWQGDIFPVKAGSHNEKTIFLQDGPVYLICVYSTSAAIYNDDRDVRSCGVAGPVRVSR